MILDSAIQYAQRGWAVFPCARNGKIPLTKRGFRDAVKDRESAHKLFAAHPECNVAIATGAVSGFFILDVDNHNGIDGGESLKELEAQFGDLPDTVEVLTPSGGRHLYFKYPEGGIGNRTKVRPGLDTRGDGGYVVCPPSTIDGKPYTWEAEHHPDNIEIIDAPEWLLNILQSDHSPAQPAQKDETGDKITAGARNDHLMRKGVAMRKLGLPYETILQGLKDLNRTKCNPTLTDKEVSTIAQSVSRYEPEKKKPVNFTKEPYTDVWNAKLFFEKYGNSIRYCDMLGGWHIWDGTRWLRDDRYQIVSLAKDTVKQMFDQSTANSDKELYRHAERSESESRLKSMINLTKSIKDVPILSHQFDENQYVINCLNGTLDLQTGKMMPHLKENHITKRIDIAYNPKAQCPTWGTFLKSIFLENQETIHFVHKALGYSLSGSIQEQCIFILYGVGSNGKSTFLETIAKVMGDYAMSTLSATIMEKNNTTIPNDIARLKGARFVNAIETEENKRLAESVIKSLTGGDKIVARFLNREFFEFHATFKIFLATNHKPRISGTDNGIWRRIKYIPFKKVIVAEERDKALQEKLLAEHEGILSWMVEGFKIWQAEGLGSCSEIDKATAEYREESDILREFIADRCVIGEDCEIQATALYKELSNWCRDNGGYRIVRGKLIEYLESKGFKKDRKTSGDDKGAFFWSGIGLKTSEDFHENSFTNSSGERPF